MLTRTDDEKEQRIHIRVKLTVETDERFFGPGICELLERIDQTGSIQAAAARMDMSYTKAWKIINRAERIMNRALITRTNGGASGGSSVLTEDGRTAVAAFRKMENQLLQESKRLFEEVYTVFSPETDS